MYYHVVISGSRTFISEMKWFLRLVLAGGLRFGLYEVLSITWRVDCVGGEVAQMEKTHKSNLSLIRISENSFHM